MDLQKEKEAFELVVANKLQNSLYHSVFFNEVTGRYDCADDAPAGVQVFCRDLNSDFRIWQAAKAQAVPDGFVVVHIDALARAAQNIRELNNGEYYSEEIEENVCNIEAIIEAQEPANDI